MQREHLEEITALRHRLHERAELAMEERQTRETLIRFLKERTALEVEDRGRWFYAHYRSGNRAAPALAFRSDFDALAIDEGPGLPYRSRNSGISHRCGHDGHSAALAGLALEADKLGAGRDLYFIFQHAEEIGGGGEECAGLITEKGIAQVYAFHNMSGYPLGSVMVRDGVTQCASKGLTVRFLGTPAHASQPEDGRNPAGAAARLVLKSQEAAAADGFSGMVMATVVQVAVGNKNFGIAAHRGEVSMTLRADYERDLVRLEETIRRYAGHLAENEGLSVSFGESDVFPETVNDPACARLVREAAQACGYPVVAMKKPFRASEDFGHYLKRCPGAMFYLGNGESYAQLHTSGYDFHDRILERAVELFKKIIELA